MNNVCYSIPNAQFVAGSSVQSSTTADTITRTGLGEITNGLMSSVDFDRLTSGCAMRSMFGCHWGNNKYLFLGEGTGNTNMATSVLANDCVSVAGSNGIFSTQGNSAAYDAAASQWVAVGQGTNTIAYSLNDAASFIGVGVAVFSTAGHGVATMGRVPSTSTVSCGTGGSSGGNPTTLRVVCASGYVQASQGVTNPTQNTFNSSVVRDSIGRYTITLSPAFSTALYEVFTQVDETAADNDDIQINVESNSRTTSQFRILIGDQDNGGTAGVLLDRDFSYQALCDRTIGKRAQLLQEYRNNSATLIY